MEPKDYISVGFIVILAALLIFAAQALQEANPRQAQITVAPPTTDAHGCEISNGYSWCELNQKCLGAAEAPCLRILTEEFAPFNYMAADGSITGQSTDMVREMLNRTNQTADIKLMNWTDAYNLALSAPNVALYSTARTSARERLFKWVGPIGSWEYTFYARAGSGVFVSSLEEAKKARAICVVKDDARHQFLTENGFTNVVTAIDDSTCAGSVLSGSADLWLGSSDSFRPTMAKAGYGASAFTAVYGVRRGELYVAFGRNVSDDFVQGWQRALDNMKADGAFDKITSRYGTTAAANMSAQNGSMACALVHADITLIGLIGAVDGAFAADAASLNELAQENASKSGDWAKIRPLLANHSSYFPAAAHWFALPNGTYYTVEDGLASGNLKNRSYFPVAMSGRVSIGELVQSKSTGRTSAVVVVPIMSNGTAIGALGHSVFLDNVSSDLSASLELPAGMHFFALDSQGQYALHSDTAKILSNPVKEGDAQLSAAMLQILSNWNGTVDYASEGKPTHAVYRTSALTGWEFVIAGPPTNGTAWCG